MSIEKAVLAIESTEIPIWWEHDPTETPEETPEETKPAIESTEIPIWWEHDPTETPEETRCRGRRLGRQGR